MANFFDKMRVDPRRRGALATMAGSMITQGVMNMNPEDLELGARIEKMRKIVRDSVRQSMISNGMNEAEVERALSGMTDQQWNQMASNAWGSLEQGAHASGQNLRNFVTRNSDKVVNARERAKAAAGGEADVRAKVGGKGAAGLTQRVIDAITNSDGTEDIKTIIARILGGVPASELEGLDAGIARPPGKGDDAGRKVRDLGREGAKPLEGEVGRDTGKDTGGLRIVGTLTLKGLDEALLSGEVIVPAVDSTPVHP